MAGDRAAGGRYAPRAAAVADRARAEVATVAKALVLRIDANLRRPGADGGTPIATGHASANWVPSIGMPSRLEVEGTATGEHDSGVAAILAYELADGPLFVSNNVDYIQMLNRGHSAQAEAGFVERAVEAAFDTVQAQFGTVDISAVRGAYRADLGAAAATNLADAFNPFGGD